MKNSKAPRESSCFHRELRESNTFLAIVLVGAFPLVCNVFRFLSKKGLDVLAAALLGAFNRFSVVSSSPTEAAGRTGRE